MWQDTLAHAKRSPEGIQKEFTRRSRGVQREFRGPQGESKESPRGVQRMFRGVQGDFKGSPRGVRGESEGSPREVLRKLKVVREWFKSGSKVGKTDFFREIFFMIKKSPRRFLVIF